MDDDEPDFTADEIDDMWEFGGNDLEYETAMGDALGWGRMNDVLCG